MTALYPVKGRPLPVVHAGRQRPISLASESAFWAGLSCRFPEATLSPLTGHVGGSRSLLGTGFHLLAPEPVYCDWVRYELSIVVGDLHPLSVFPELVIEPSGLSGVVRTTLDGKVERDLVPGGTDIPAFTIGRVDSDTVAVWDILPWEGQLPAKVESLLILLEGDDVAPIMRHRLLLGVISRHLGRRLAVFTVDLATVKGAVMNLNGDLSGGLIETIVLGDPEESVATLKSRLEAAKADFAILISGTEIVGVVSREQVQTVPADITVQGLVSGSVPPMVDVSASTESIAAAVAARLDAEPNLLGAVVLDGDVVVGLLPASVLRALLADSTVRGEVDRLEGDPLSQLVFECRAHGQQTNIAYYDPDDPPRCSFGDLMTRRR